MPHESIVDLHGLSVEQAKYRFNNCLAMAMRDGVSKVRLVTGRGNHLNSRGERGTIYNQLLAWLETTPYRHGIEKCVKNDGYYEITLKRDTKQPAVLLSTLFEHHCPDVYRTVVTEIMNLAKKGDALWLMAAGNYLEQGIEGVVEKNPKLGFQYYRQAAEKNLPEAFHALGVCYALGRGVRRNDKKAFECFNKAANLNLPESIVEVGNCFWMGQGVEPCPRTAISYYAKASSLGNSIAMRKLGYAYYCGEGVEKSIEKSFVWYKKAADNGDTTAQYNTAVKYLRGEGVATNTEQALFYFQQSSEGGDPDAQAILGEVLFTGCYGKLDKEKGLYWLEEAARNGSAGANLLLLDMTENAEKRKTLLQQAAAAGDYLAKLELLSQGISPEEKKALGQKLQREAYDLPDREIMLLRSEARGPLLDSMMLAKNKKYRNKAQEILSALAKQGCEFSAERLQWWKKGRAFYENRVIAQNLAMQIFKKMLRSPRPEENTVDTGKIVEEKESEERKAKKDQLTVSQEKSSVNQKADVDSENNASCRIM